MGAGGIYQHYTDDVKTYLSSKLPELSEHIVLEVSAYISNRTMILVNDMLIDQEKERRYQRRMAMPRE